MKPAIFVFLLSVSFAAVSQSDTCSFPELWIPDASSFRVLDGDLDDSNPTKYLPDSVVFVKKQMKIWKDGDVLKGKFKQSRNSIQWKFKTENYKVSNKTFSTSGSDESGCVEGSLVCELVKCGISFSWIKAGNSMKRADVEYKLMPSFQNGK